MRFFLIRALSLLLLFSCSSKDNETIDPAPNPNPDPTPQTYTFENITSVFEFENQSRYAYAPTLIREDNGNVHMYFCGNPQEQIMVDNVYHIYMNADGSKSEAKSVVQPGASGAWDDHHICDPSVVGGSFKMNGKSYKYAMAYLTNSYAVYFNEIGVAFSNDLSANNWDKYPKQIVEKTWSYSSDQLLPNGGKSWGVGQPSILSVDKQGKVMLVYTIGDIDGTRLAWAEMDFSDMDNFEKVTPVNMVDKGLMQLDVTKKDYTCNSDFAIDRDANTIVMVRPVQPNATDYPTYLNKTLEVNYMSLDDFKSSTGTWKVLLRIKPETTGFPRNHNAGIERDQYGEISNWEEPVIYYTTSKAAPDVEASGNKHAEWTYFIRKGQVVKNSK
ncbi:sugar-binding protein [Dysgonomonas sp. Marseille-P4677]|nr:sugar-binding protein [Dysgonomonas sp. Marseille-P4677]